MKILATFGVVLAAMATAAGDSASGLENNDLNLEGIC